jgi:hypothetical protein
MRRGSEYPPGKNKKNRSWVDTIGPLLSAAVIVLIVG